MMRSHALGGLCLAFVLGCSNSEEKSSNAANDTGGAEWSTLIEGSWSLPPEGEEPEHCIHRELEEDLYISAIRPVHPFGTHHTLLSASDEIVGCNASLTVGDGLIYAAGVGSEGFELPEGVALKIPAGKVVNLGLHLYNTTPSEITGTSAIEVRTVNPADVEYEAEGVLVGPFDIDIPPRGRHTMTDECAVTEEQTIFAIFPHMHQMGVHFKATFVKSGEEILVHDEPYDFAEQYQIPIDPVKLAPGDTIRTECTWENPTEKNVGFGESSDTEMCFNVLFQYPKRGRSFCTGGGGGGGGFIDGPPCAEEGAAGNEVGVGKHCTKGGGQCGGQASICLADYVSGEFGNFCTSLCDSDADCGEGAVCAGSGERAACFPVGCVSALQPGDAGAPAGDGG